MSEPNQPSQIFRIKPHGVVAFLDRPPTQEIVYATSGPLIKGRIEDGDTVVLRLPDTDVIVKNVTRYSDGGEERYFGTLSHFADNPWTEHSGWIVGEKVAFTEAQVFICERR